MCESLSACEQSTPVTFFPQIQVVLEIIKKIYLNWHRQGGLWLNPFNRNLNYLIKFLSVFFLLT